jgi:uncharacterized protein (DUF1697 family)
MHINPPIAIFLRGINVNGSRIAMADLSACLQDAGYTQMHTILATGNVVCVPPNGLPAESIKSDVERILTQRFEYPATVHLRSQAELCALTNAAALLTVAAEQHCYAVIADTPATIHALASAYAALPNEPLQQFVACGIDALWVVPKGQTITAPFGKVLLGSARYKANVTTRTIATIEKVRAALAKSQ